MTLRCLNEKIFEKELCRRFGGLVGVDIVKEFNKLIQENTILKYQESFEETRSLLLTENSRHS